jgi:hypothetical protein
MATKPFLEIKVNTDPAHFALELFRITTELKPREFPYADRIEVHASEAFPDIRRVFLHNVEITYCPRAPLAELNQLDGSSWTLSVREKRPIHRVSDHFSFELHTIGGAYPLLIRLFSCSFPLYPLLEHVIARCRTLWDGQLVSVNRQSHVLYGFFQHTDARTSPWLSLLEQEFFGATHADKAPSVQRTVREQASLRAQAHRAASSPPDVAVDAPLLMKEVGSNQSDRLPARPARQPREETREKLAKLRELFAQKQSGERANLSWNFACHTVKLDLKTAEAYEPELKAAWLAMDATKR